MPRIFLCFSRNQKSMSLTRREVEMLVNSCENNTERLVILASAELGLAALEICSLSLFNIIHGRWLVVKDIKNNGKKSLLLPSSIGRLLLAVPRKPENPREVREIVLRVAERARVKVTPTDLRRLFKEQQLFI